MCHSASPAGGSNLPSRTRGKQACSAVSHQTISCLQLLLLFSCRLRPRNLLVDRLGKRRQAYLRWAISNARCCARQQCDRGESRPQREGGLAAALYPTHSTRRTDSSRQERKEKRNLTLHLSLPRCSEKESTTEQTVFRARGRNPKVTS